MDITQLRLAHPRLVYEGYDLAKTNRDLWLTFRFFLEPDIHFQAKLKFKNLDQKMLEQITDQATLDPQLDKLFFHLGLAEILVTSKPLAHLKLSSDIRDKSLSKLKLFGTIY
jgi:hypothetical protein